ncbi:meprin A subunit beta-like [Protopterus annectens]|uniref:meprin A subunit beta-like n=1 Tax=Protopterus annectens TaxID=7888 RepID=UPI001CFBD265|nr:meprin A subunit beta-like [Protopterus annectens]
MIDKWSRPYGRAPHLNKTRTCRVNPYAVSDARNYICYFSQTLLGLNNFPVIPCFISSFEEGFGFFDISHLLQPEFVPGTCSNNSCENGGLCFVKKNKTECRCKADNDFWYMGERCEKKRRAEVPVDIGLASSFAAAASVLMTVIISVYCIRKDYYNKLTEFNDDCSFENTTSC